MATDKSTATDGTAALEKAMDVLDAIATHPQGASQADLSAQLGLPRTTLYRLLSSLAARGYVRRDPQRRVYSLGFKCFELARRAYAAPDLASAAAIELRMLRDLTGETTYLAVLDGIEVLSIERFDGAHVERSHSELGVRKPLHCTSQGKAILSALPLAQRDRLLRELPLRAVTPRSITDRRRLAAELTLSAARGYAIDDEEIVPGIRCVGAPIVDKNGTVCGAMSVAGPAWRMTLARVEHLGPELAAAARRIGAELRARASVPTSDAVHVMDGAWAFHGMSPAWLPARDALIWADALAPAIHITNGEHTSVFTRLEAPIEHLLVIDDGRSVIAWGDAGFSVIPLEAKRRKVNLSFTPWERTRVHAACTHPSGEVWVIASELSGRATVGVWNPDTQLYTARANVPSALDALAWSPQGTTLYGLDSDGGEILTLNPQSRAATRRLTSVPKGSGRPGGLCVDPQGGIWTALRDGWSVLRFTAEGNLDRVISVPVPAPTGVAIGGARSEYLFITSARQSVSMEALTKAPLSGRLFRVPLSEAA